MRGEPYDAGIAEYIVDGMNVIGSRPDGWWRDRAGARRRLVEQLAILARAGDTITVVFDGHPPSNDDSGEDAGDVRTRFAPGGPDAADDAIVELAHDLEDPTQVTVVTSDAALARRVRRLGAMVEGARTFRSRLGRASLGRTTSADDEIQ